MKCITIENVQAFLELETTAIPTNTIYYHPFEVNVISEFHHFNIHMATGHIMYISNSIDCLDADVF